MDADATRHAVATALVIEDMAAATLADAVILALVEDGYLAGADIPAALGAIQDVADPLAIAPG